MFDTLHPTRDALKTILCLAVVVVSMAACGSCGSSTNSGSSSSATNSGSTSTTKPGTNITLPSDICTLVTADEASAALGTAVANLSAQVGAAIPGACFYSNAPPSPGSTPESPPPQVAMLIFAQSYPDSSTAQAVQPDQLAAAFRGLYGIASAKPVSGIGDKAFEYTATSAASGSNGIAIFVFKANIVLFIVMSPTTDSSKIESVARTAAGRLH